MGGCFDAVEGACDGDGIDIGLCCQHGFFLSQKNTSMLTPYPEVAGPIKVPKRDFLDEIVFLAVPDSLRNEYISLHGTSIIQLDQVEVAIVNGLHIGIIAKVVVSLFISVFKKVGASPLPGIRIIPQVIARYLKLFRQVATT